MSHIRSALGRSLEGRITEMPKEDQPALRQDVQAFLACFPNAKIKMGESLLIFKSSDGNVYVSRPVLLLAMLRILGQRTAKITWRMAWKDTFTNLPRFLFQHAQGRYVVSTNFSYLLMLMIQFVISVSNK